MSGLSPWQRWARKIPEREWELRMLVLDMFQLQENQIGDLTQALKEAGIHIPFGYAEAERNRRIEEGKKMMGL